MAIVNDEIVCHVSILIGLLSRVCYYYDDVDKLYEETYSHDDATNDDKRTGLVAGGLGSRIVLHVVEGINLTGLLVCKKTHNEVDDTTTDTAANNRCHHQSNRKGLPVLRLRHHLATACR